jgi:hypothetical protein
LNDKHHTDPIELAGLFEGDIILAARRNGTDHVQEKNGIIYERQKWPGGVVPYFISSQFGKIKSDT